MGTLVKPRVAPAESTKRTKTRLVAGANGIAPPAVAKIPKVGVAFDPIPVVTADPAACRHTPVVGLVWQRVSATGRLTEPGSTVTKMPSLVPRVTVATAKIPEPARP